MNIHFYNDSDTESILQCPVCYDVPRSDIFLCKVGHHMCGKCRKRLTVCPTCQSALTGSRNFLAEALIARFLVFKDFPNDNEIVHPTSTGNLETSVIQLEENQTPLKPLPLPEGVYKCLLESCRNKKEIGVGHLITHVQNVHAHLYEKFQNKISTFSHNFESFCLMKARRKYHRAFHVSNMGLFYLNLEVLEDRYINCWLSIPTPIRKANRFHYEIEFSKEDDERKLRFVSKSASNMQSIQWLMERGRVFIISPNKHNLKVGDFFSLFIKIVYKAS